MLPPITLLDASASTNDLAMDAAHQGAPHGACWLSDHQRAGRGRREPTGSRRTWHSPAGRNIHLSLLLRPALSPQDASALTLASALAARRALLEHAPALHPDLWIKWPNDLWVGERKLAGILTEGVMTGASLEAVVVGVGINVNLEYASLPEELREVATSVLHETGHTTDRLALALSLRQQLLTVCEIFCEQGLGVLLDELRALDRTSGRRVLSMRGQQEVEGIARGLSDEGHLLVELPDGSMQAVHAGEVRFLGKA